MAATAQPATTEMGAGLPEPEHRYETDGPIVDGFRDATVADHLHEDAGDEQKSVTTRVYEQMATFNRLVTGGVTLAVGILVYNEVIGSLPSSSGAINQTAVTGTVESAFQLAPVALIVLIAAVILSQVMGFRS